MEATGSVGCSEEQGGRSAWPAERMHALLTYQHFPLAVGLRHFVSTAHLIQAHTPEDENNEAGATAVLPGGLILVPMSIAGADGGRESRYR